MIYGLLADVLVFIHSAYVGYVVIGQLAILVGGIARWKWVRNVKFRVTHLVMMSIVGFEAAFDIQCPLTVWEKNLRIKAEQPINEASFIGKLMHDILFIDLPEWAFRYLHLGFAALVIGSIFLIPPRWKKKPEQAATAKADPATNAE